MRVIFRLFGQLRSTLGNKAEVEIELEDKEITVLEAIEFLTKTYPELDGLLFTNKKLHSFYNIMINSKTIHHEELSTYLVTEDKTEISILPFVAGG
ncbi:MAG: MoaD/ThiS family protein [Candidatus Heimdallarchaeum aukensis]|uniref:MoaD/ThiS family protein n=1 Tax=Candidatus Heimdallarchaeum aukensis TaxID=2876573 RepID=A0A9Y1FM57_9ARCH|nr:MAG: MoaD/ThiS family protein [Candidatus Heimdallarchaeum aukensis]